MGGNLLPMNRAGSVLKMKQVSQFWRATAKPPRASNGKVVAETCEILSEVDVTAIS